MRAIRVDVTPNENGIAAVRHDLGSDQVSVHARTADGEIRQVTTTNVITTDEVEIITSLDTASVLVVTDDD